MRIYTIGDLFLSPYADHMKAYDGCCFDKGSLVVCSTYDLSTELVGAVKASDSVRLCVVGCPSAECAKGLPSDSFVVPYNDSFGSLQFLFAKLRDSSIEKKGIFRYVKCGRLESEKKCADEVAFTLSSVLYLLEECIGGVQKHFDKVFKDENYYRFNSIITMNNGTIFFFEQKYSAQMIPSEYWEYAFKDGIVVSDSYKEMPMLCISADGSKCLLDAFRLTGNLDRVAKVLADCSVGIDEYLKKGSLKDLADVTSALSVGGAV